MAASTASMCLRSESLSVHSQSRFHASSRFKVCLPPVGRSQASGFRLFEAYSSHLCTRRALGYTAAQDTLLAPTAQIPEKVVSGSPSRRSRTSGASGAGPRVASGSEPSPVVSGPSSGEARRVLSSRSSGCPVVARSSPAVSPEQETASEHRKAKTAATRAFAVATLAWIPHRADSSRKRDAGYRAPAALAGRVHRLELRSLARLSTASSISGLRTPVKV